MKIKPLVNILRLIFGGEKKNDNADLTLNIVKYLLRSEEWENAKVRIIYINNSTSASNDIELQIQKTIENFRINAEIILINNFIEKRSFNELSTSISAETDLIIAGIPDIENENKFVSDTNDLFKILGTTLLVKASSSLNEINIDNVEESNNEIENLQSYFKNTKTTQEFDEINDDALKDNLSKLYEKLNHIRKHHFETILQDTLKYNHEVISFLENENEDIQNIIKLPESQLSNIDFYKNALKKNILKLLEELKALPENELEVIKIKVSVDDELKYIKTKRRKAYYKLTKLFKKNRQKNIYWKDLIKYRISIDYINSINKVLNQLTLTSNNFEQDLIKFINGNLKKNEVLFNYKENYKNIYNLIDNMNITFCNNIINQTKIPHTNSHNEKLFLNIKKPFEKIHIKIPFSFHKKLHHI